MSQFRIGSTAWCLVAVRIGPRLDATMLVCAPQARQLSQTVCMWCALRPSLCPPSTWRLALNTPKQSWLGTHWLMWLSCCAGTRSIQMLYRAVLFTFAPTFIELVFVVGLLANRFSPMVAVLVGCTFALYVAWTLSMTQVCLLILSRCSGPP